MSFCVYYYSFKVIMCVLISHRAETLFVLFNVEFFILLGFAGWLVYICYWLIKGLYYIIREYFGFWR